MKNYRWVFEDENNLNNKINLIKNYIVRKTGHKTTTIGFADDNHAKFDADSKKEC